MMTIATALAISNRHSQEKSANTSKVSARLSIGRQQTANPFVASNDPRLSWCGFSFGAYWFSYFYFFSNASPFSAGENALYTFANICRSDSS